MPFTPYHFGPSGFIALIFRKFIDLPVFLLANVIVDIEVLLYRHWPVHRYVHTLLIGAAAGALWGLLAYPLRNFFKYIMNLFKLPYQTSLPKMLLSGVLGVWLHVVIDAIYHGDVRIFYPSNAKPLWNLLSQSQVKSACIALLIAAVVMYLYIIRKPKKQPKPE